LNKLLNNVYEAISLGLNLLSVVSFLFEYMYFYIIPFYVLYE